MRNRRSPQQSKKLAAGRLGGRGFLVLVCGWMILAESAFAQFLPDNNGLGGLNIADRNRTRVIREAQDMIARGDYLDALNFLQSLLDLEQDLLLRPSSTDPSGVFRSMKTEIQRIIEHLPPAGREVYLRNTNPAAEALLKQAIEQNDADKLAQVSRLYYHTPAGYEATYRMGMQEFDHGEPMLAALILSRLRRTPEAAKRYEPMLTLRIVLSWIEAGMPEEARKDLAALWKLRKAGPLQVAGGNQELFKPAGEPSPWLAEMMRRQSHPQYANASDWLMPQRVPSRNAILPVMESVEIEPWRIRTVVDHYTKDPSDLIETEIDITLQSMVNVQRSSRQRQSLHGLPSRQPLVVGGLVFSRMLESVRLYDLETGEFYTQTSGWDPLLEELVAPTQGQPIPNANVLLGQLLNQRLWDDATFGRLSSDGTRLFCIEDTGLWNPVSGGKDSVQIPVSTANVLNAHEITTGKLLWEIGGIGGIQQTRNLAGRYFLGPPLPVAGRLYCLADVNGEVQLTVLDSETGQLIWSQVLATTAANSIVSDRARRSSGASVAYGDGILVCPTDVGATVALDLTSRTLLWGFPTESSQPTPGNQRGVRIRVVPNPNQTAVMRPQGWVDSTPTIFNDKVVLTPLKSSKIYLLDLRSGKRIWEQPRGQGLYVAGITQEMVIVVGTNNVQTWSMNNDQTGWKNPLALSAVPTGRGLIVGTKLLLPADKELLVVDVKTGKELPALPAPEKVQLGNLVLAQGRLISQSVDSLDVIPLPALD